MVLPLSIRASLHRNWKAFNAAVGITVDVAVLLLASFVSMTLNEWVRGSQAGTHSPGAYLGFSIGVYVISFTMLGIYRKITYLSFRSQLYSAFRGHLYSSIILFAVVRLFGNVIPKPSFFAYFVVLYPFLYVAMWGAVRKTLQVLRRLGVGRANTIAIGSDPDFQELIRRLKEHVGLKFNIVSTLRSEKLRPEDRFDHVDVESVQRLINEHDIDQIVFSSSYQLNGSFDPLHELCRRNGIAMRIMSEESDVLFAKVGLRDIAGIPIYVPEALKVRYLKGILKRMFDILGAAFLLVLLSPVFLVVAVAIKLESRGPVFFQHLRSLGAGDKPFYFLKFRSMHVHAEKEKAHLLRRNESDGALFKMKDDPRLTGVGRVIRRFSIDELPQLLNVLKGDMSLVGPRPLPVKDYEQIDEDDHIGGYLHLRSNVKPGMTGLWQVSGRSNLGFREMVMLDLYYIENQTLLFDMEILAQTVPVVVFGKGAY
jgi:exopolysaccharide biosynthesis polyprenyl glycosylphosphotransferase